jgi:hypothetical protein
MKRLPARFLYTGRAREAYKALGASAGYSPLRSNAAARVARAHLSDARSWLLLGAGPDPIVETRVLAETRATLDRGPSGSRLVVAHDVDECGSAHAAERLLAESASIGPAEIRYVSGDLLALEGECAGRVFDVATLLGYTWGNVRGSVRAAALGPMGIRAKRLLLDVAIANSDRDPRVHSTIGKLEMEWYRASIEEWAIETGETWRSMGGSSGYDGPIVQRAVGSIGGGYRIDVVATGLDLALISFSRKSLPDWIGGIEAGGAGWEVDAVEVTRDDAPLARAVILASSKHWR